MPAHAAPAPVPPASGAPSHDDLLVVARAVRTAALGDDVEPVRAALARLRADVAHHVRAEEGRLVAASAAARAVVHQGQHRLLALVDLAIGDVRACACTVRATELEVALRRQARLEDILLGRPTRPAGDPGPDRDGGAQSSEATASG